MRVFITGGSGFVGLALVARLLAEGAEVTALAAAAPPDWARGPLAGARFMTGDVTDAAALHAALAAARPDVLIHAAAMTPDAAREAAGDAARVVAVNVGGTATAIEAAAAQGVGRVMLMSSVAVYGRTLPETPRLHEADTVCTPANLYGLTKHAAERLALRLGAVHRMPVIAPRLGVAWGPWEHRTGARPTPSSPFQIMAQALAGRAVAVRPGTAAPLIYIDDAVAALVALLTAPIPGDGVVNVGATALSDLHALAGLMADACGAPPPVHAEPTIALLGPGRPPMDGTRLAALAGVAPQPADAAQVAAYLAWLRSLPDPQAPFA